MTDYLMVFALMLLVAGLSLPTIIQLSALLKEKSNNSPTGIR